MNRIDWAYLRRPLIIFGLALVVAAVLIGVGHRYESGQIEKYESAVSALRSTHSHYLNVVNDIGLLDQYRNLYHGYKSSGMIGEERRLSWIESLENTNQALKLPQLSYTLRPQGEFLRPGLKMKREVDLKGSPMDLSMGLLHEEDLFAVLEGLRLSIKNLFTVESCSLTRNAKIGVSLSMKSANLSARCTIRWVTIDVE